MARVKKGSESTELNLTTALLLLVMLLVVIVSLLTHMLFESQRELSVVEANQEQIFCIPITPAP